MEQTLINPKYIELENAVKEVLKRQDSDYALTLITKGAIALGSSDIHYDRNEKDVAVRFRIDGSLATVFTLNHAEYKLLLERLKYKSELKLNITNIPQDGKYRIADENVKIDVRISTLPIKDGENAVTRILDSSASVPRLDNLGLIWTAKRQIDASIKKKNGMILVTWPTGSGKTTTLYSMLSTLNVPDKKIITLEDPIEYEMPWIVQSEVNEKGGYTYANGLKALLRQDPDIIMIGEIRDLETAMIAMQASLTGHLVLSTLHTKSATETLERLLNLWVPGYILGSAIDMIIAQRLVRKLCDHCKTEYTATEGENKTISWMLNEIGIGAVERAKKQGFTLCKANGCEHCGFTGYKGRIGVYEVLRFNTEIRDLIRGGASPESILAEGRKQDLLLMREDGILKAMRWKTTLEEVLGMLDV